MVHGVPGARGRERGKGCGIREAGVRREMLGARSGKRGAWDRARNQGSPDWITGNLGSRSHTVTMGRECLRWWMSHRDRVCTLCCELLNSDSFFSSAASEKADIPPKPRSRRPTPWSRGEESVAALVAASPPHPTLPHALTTATPESEAGRKLARWRPAGSDVMRRPRPSRCSPWERRRHPEAGVEGRNRAEETGTMRYSAPEGQKKASDPLELELQTVVSHCVSAEN
ncbi:hypothetical protein NN561_014435 [Cricetulus griseus]